MKEQQGHFPEDTVEEMVYADLATQRGGEKFWEELGRAVATLGMLEDTLTRALGVVRLANALGVVWLPDAVADPELKEDLKNWGERVKNDFSTSLGKNVEKLEGALREQEGDVPEAYKPLIEEARAIAEERNLLCHGAWIRFEEPNVGTVRYFERGSELSGEHQQQRSLQCIQATRERSVAITIMMVREIERTYGIAFPGKSIPVQQSA